MFAKAIIFILAALGTLANPAVTANAQDYPNKVVRLVVPYPASGTPDQLARQVANRLTQSWGQPVVVENRPGAGTIIGAELVARSAPDGYTILFTTDPTMTVNVFLYQKLPYDPDKDFIPVSQLLEWHMVMMASPSLPANNLQELVAYAKANPGKLSYASYGKGSQAHLAAELLKATAGLDITHVPYKGMADALPATLRGDVQFTFGSAITARPLLEAGRLKVLGIGGTKRSSLMLNVPTFAEQGFTTVEAPVWLGIFVAAGTPVSIVERIRRDFVALFNEPEFKQREATDRGYAVVGSSPAEFAAYIKKDRESRGRAVRLAGIRPE
jgi:tripartite-type tricarboxylate transporter receptor subunit TctC